MLTTGGECWMWAGFAGPAGFSVEGSTLLLLLVTFVALLTLRSPSAGLRGPLEPAFLRPSTHAASFPQFERVLGMESPNLPRACASTHLLNYIHTQPKRVSNMCLTQSRLPGRARIKGWSP